VPGGGLNRNDAETENIKVPVPLAVPGIFVRKPAPNGVPQQFLAGFRNHWKNAFPCNAASVRHLFFSGRRFPMTLSTWLAYLLAVVLICLSPGPGALSAMSAGMKYGWQRALWNCLGMQVSTIINVTIIALGLGALLGASTTAFDVMKWCGALYLVYLGIRKFREPAAMFADIDAQTEFRDTRARGIFTQGLLVNFTNPKGLIFLLAVLPQFIDPAKPTAVQYLILTATMVAVDLTVMSGYAGLAARLLRLLKDPGQLRAVNRVLGSLFMVAGATLAVFKRA
jgi:homoserine/homoserine lactone efflux protein